MAEKKVAKKKMFKITKARGGVILIEDHKEFAEKKKRKIRNQYWTKVEEVK